MGTAGASASSHASPPPAVREAMILAAGLGTRLRPLTERMPKALVPVAGAPLLERVARRLIEAGARRLVVNAHHHADRIERFLGSRAGFGVEVRVSREDDAERPLETGGGLRRAGPLFEGEAPFFLHNVDVLSDVDLRAMYARHLEAAGSEGRGRSVARPQGEGAPTAGSPGGGPLLATLAVQARETSRPLLVDEAGVFGLANRRTGWRRTAREPAGEVRELGFCGIHVVSPEIHGRITERGRFPIWDPYLRLVGDGWRILPYDIGAARWLEVGTPERLARARELLSEG